MTRSGRILRVAAVSALAVLATACTRPGATASIKAQPSDLYAATPSLSDVRTLLGDDNWWPGPPSFGVRPLDVASMPFTEKFVVMQPYVHVGSAETFAIAYAMWDTVAAAKSRITDVQTAFGTSVAGPKVGDQALYYGAQGSGAAPFNTATFVRLGQIVITISESQKDGFPKVSQLGRIAAKVVSRLSDVISGKVHASPVPASDAAVLPPANLDITLLGTARISVETAMVMIDAPSIDELAQTLRGLGVSDLVFGDYVLNSDTHMEVRASVFNFLTAKDATDWLDLLRSGNPVDQTGITSFYDATHGKYMFLFVSGTRGALMICRSTAESESASRACEAPLSRVAAVWHLSLG